MHVYTLLDLQFICLQTRSLPLLRCQRLHVPDAVGILPDAPITAEETHPRNARDALADPLVLVLVRLVHESLGLVVAVEVVRDEVVIPVIFNGPDERTKSLGVAKHAALDGLKDLQKIGVERVATIGVSVAKVFDILGQIAKEENVVLANLTSDFNLHRLALNMLHNRGETNVSTITGTNDQTTV